jgi:uncharacterized protein (TIGR03546 family)
MLSLLLRPVRQFAQALIGNDSPRQIAWGLVLGMLIGLVPKGNLLVAILGMMLLGLRVNKSAGLVSAGVFTGLGIFLDPLAHKLGSWVLVNQSLRPMHIGLYDSALGPWLGLNNTVVVGQLLIGLYLAYPVYWTVRQFAARVQIPVSRWLHRFRVVRWLRGAELGSQWGIEG